MRACSEHCTEKERGLRAPRRLCEGACAAAESLTASSEGTMPPPPPPPRFLLALGLVACTTGAQDCVDRRAESCFRAFKSLGRHNEQQRSCLVRP